MGFSVNVVVERQRWKTVEEHDSIPIYSCIWHPTVWNWYEHGRRLCQRLRIIWSQRGQKLCTYTAQLTFVAIDENFYCQLFVTYIRAESLSWSARTDAGAELSGMSRRIFSFKLRPRPWESICSYSCGCVQQPDSARTSRSPRSGLFPPHRSRKRTQIQANFNSHTSEKPCDCRLTCGMDPFQKST